MRRGCWALVAVVLSAGCGGQSEVHRKTGATHETACTTSHACPHGERCEGGSCVPDSRCPSERESALLFEAAPGSPFALESAFPSFTTFGEREFVVTSVPDASGALSGITRFHELSTGREMIFEHDPGYARCRGVPARCTLATPDYDAIFEIELGQDRVTPVEGTRFTFYGIDWLASSDADYQAGEVAVAAGNRVELHALGRLPPIASVDFGDLRPAMAIADASGRSRRMTAFWPPVTTEPAEFAVAELESGAQPELLYSGPLGQNGLIGLPDEDGWFILRDGGVDEPELVNRTVVYRSSSAGGDMLGSIEGSWISFVPFAYRSGDSELASGPSVYAYRCDREDGCASHRLTLDPVGIEEVSRVPLPEQRLRGSYARPLACGGADVIVFTSEGTDSPTRYFSVRIPGREGFP